MLILNFIIVIITLAILVKASDYFVDSAAKLARLLGISDYIIGFTLIAIGTSLPELVSSISASLYKSSDLLTGNIIGSNIANIGLIIGLAAMIKPLSIEKRVFSKEGLFLIFTSVLLFILSLNLSLSREEGIILLSLFIAYSLVLLETDILKGKLTNFVKSMFRSGVINTVKNNFEKRKTRKKLSKKDKIHLLYLTFIIVISGGAMYLAAKYLIPAAENIALGLGVKSSVIGALMLAVGTSLPELFVAISSIKKGLGNMLIGTIIGSNISNIALILGISAIISPIIMSSLALYYFLPVMLILTILLLAFIRSYWLLRLFEGFELLMIYVLFIVVLIFIS